GAAALPILMRSASAQRYPARSIAIIVPYATGGATDVIVRLVAQRMRAPLGQPVIIENVTGAGGSIAVGRVARPEECAPTGLCVTSKPTARSAGPSEGRRRPPPEPRAGPAPKEANCQRCHRNRLH